jgi:acyl transferase domain-containing protein/NADPH:quinone reductase-like Zn-dependent oxidoreductase
MTKGPLERKTMKEEIETQTSERLFVLSANDKSSTEKAMQKLGVYLEQRPEIFQNDLLSNLAYTLGQRKSLHSWRIAITASSSADLVVALSCGKILPCKQDLQDLSIGWVFTGQGAQWWAMGRELYDQYPIYTAAIDRADAHLRRIGADFSLKTELTKDETATLVNAAYISQPSCTAIQLALVDLLQSWGLRPSAVVGHSSGEIGAAYAAGIIGFEDAMTIAYHRGRLIPVLKKKFPTLDGCMMAVGAGESQITPLIDRIHPSLGQARVACINSPSSVTVSGDSKAVDELGFIIQETYPDMFVRKLQVDTAYHSHHMNLVAKDYTESLHGLALPKDSGIRFYSSLLGRLTTGYELDASYWVQNLTCPVRFDEAVQSMCLPVDDSKTGVNHLIELGPHAALQGPIKQILRHVGGPVSKIGYTSVLSRKKDAVQTALSLAGSLFVKGVVLDMSAVNFPKPLERPPQVLIDMPRYPWNHSTKFYHENRFTQTHKFYNAPRNDIIGILAPYSNDLEPTWRNIVRLDDLPWLRHHQMQGLTLFPIAGFLVMALEAAAQSSFISDVQYDNIVVHDLVVENPAMLTEEELEMTITLRNTRHLSSNELLHDFVIRSWSKSKGWTEHCTGGVAVKAANLNEVDSKRTNQTRQEKLETKLTTMTRQATHSVPTGSMYEQLAEIGVSYGASFQGLQNCHASSNGSVATIAQPNTLAEMPHHVETNYLLHPALIEQIISMYWPVFSTLGPLHTVHLPSRIGKTTVCLRACDRIKAPRHDLKAVCEASAPISAIQSNTISVFAFDPSGEAVIAIEDLSISPILESSINAEDTGPQELCYKLEWEPVSSQLDVEEQTVGQPVFDADVVIIHGETDLQYTMASALSAQINDLAGMQPTTGTLDSVLAYTEDKLCIFLTEIDQPILADLDKSQFEMLQRFLIKARGVLWIVHGAYARAKDPTANMVVGLSRTLRSEGTLMKFITLELDGHRDIEISSMVSTIARVFNMTLSTDSKMEETELLERDGLLHTPRMMNDHELNHYVDQQIHPSATEPTDFSNTQRPLRGMLRTPGVLDSLTFEDDESLQTPLMEEYVEFHVKAIGVNAADLEHSSTIGLECSGIVTAIGLRVPNVRVGDRIAAITMQGSLSAIARVHFRSLFKLPERLSFESAASMPLAYCNAVYAMIEQARLCEDDSVLIHDAASAVGQAAVAIAQNIGAQTWTTVRTKDEKHLLMREYGIAEDRIGFAAADTFQEEILDATRGRGVDVVFNTLSEIYLIQATWKCLADFGRLITVGSGSKTSDRSFTGKNASMFSVNIESLAKSRPTLLQRMLADVGQMLQYGKIQPIRLIKTFRVSEALAAFHHVHAAGLHGKAVIIPQDSDLIAVSNPEFLSSCVKRLLTDMQAPRIEKHHTLLRNDATYILIGGTGGLGRSMAKWMISKGGKNIVLLSRSGELKGKAKEQIDSLNVSGANIVVRRCDVANRADVEDLILTGLKDMPPVRGIIHGAMVLHVCVFVTLRCFFIDDTLGRPLRAHDLRAIH